MQRLEPAGSPFSSDETAEVAHIVSQEMAQAGSTIAYINDLADHYVHTPFMEMAIHAALWSDALDDRQDSAPKQAFLEGQLLGLRIAEEHLLFTGLYRITCQIWPMPVETPMEARSTEDKSIKQLFVHRAGDRGIDMSSDYSDLLNNWLGRSKPEVSRLMLMQRGLGVVMAKLHKALTKEIHQTLKIDPVNWDEALIVELLPEASN